MLVIKRKLGESFEMGDNIVVTINQLTAGYVSLAIHAPKSINIVRSEIKHKEPRPQGTECQWRHAHGRGLRLAVRAGRKLP